MASLTIDRQGAFPGSEGSCHKQCTVQYVFSQPDLPVLYHATCTSVLSSAPGHLQKCQKLFTSSCLSSRSQKFLWPFALIWGLVLSFSWLRHFFLYLSLVLQDVLRILQSLMFSGSCQLILLWCIKALDI